jgi:hypothetical protein
LSIIIGILSINDNEIFAQIDYNNDTMADNAFANTTQDFEKYSIFEYYNDGNIDNQTFNESMKKMDDFFSGSLHNYQQPFNEDILSNFGESLSNSVFNDTSIFALLSYSLVDNVKVLGAQIIDNNSINVTIEYNNKNNSLITTTPSVTVVAHKLDIDISDLFSFLLSALAGSEEMMMDMPSSNLFPFNNSMPIFDMMSNFKLGSNIAESGWTSPHEVSIKVTNGGVSQNESDTSIVLIELIPKE